VLSEQVEKDSLEGKCKVRHAVTSNASATEASLLGVRSHLKWPGRRLQVLSLSRIQVHLSPRLRTRARSSARGGIYGCRRWEAGKRPLLDQP